MKIFKFISLGIMLLSFMCVTTNLNAQARKEIKTSVYKIKVMFDNAKDKVLIEKELLKEAGIVKVVADVSSKTVTIDFDGTKSDRIKISKAIENIGYQTELTPKDKKINKIANKKNVVNLDGNKQTK